MSNKDILPVSVVVPTYNRGSVVCDAIDSIFRQTARPAEVIVVDDGSVDDTQSILDQRYGAQINYIRQQNQGVSAARNTGISQASQDLIAFLDSDDLWTTDKLETQFAAMRHRDVVLCATNWSWANAPEKDYFNQIGVNLSNEYQIDTDPLVYLCRSRGHGIVVQTCLCVRQKVVEIGAFDTRYRIAEDNDLIFRMGENGAFSLCPEVMMLRSADDTFSHLTEARSPAWRGENLDNMLEILAARLAQSPSHDAGAALRRRLGELRVDRGKLYASLDSVGPARRMFMQQLASMEPSKQTAVAAFGLLFPKTLGRRQ